MFFPGPPRIAVHDFKVININLYLLRILCFLVAENSCPSTLISRDLQQVKAQDHYVALKRSFINQLIFNNNEINVRTYPTCRIAVALDSFS